MSEFFLELFSEEIPSKLQVNARKYLYQNLRYFFEENKINVKGNYKVFSTPNRLVASVDKIPKLIIKNSEEIKGPNINNPFIVIN